MANYPQGHYGPPPQQAQKQGGGALKTVLIVLATLFGVGALGVVGCVLCVGGTVAGAGAAAEKGAQIREKEEQQRIAVVKTAEAKTVALSTLLDDYKDNEVRADELYKGAFVTTTGKVGDVKKDIMDNMFVTVGTGKRFEIPEVQCTLTPDNKSKAANLSKGDSVTVKGKVSGLMMNVQLEDCMIVE